MGCTCVNAYKRNIQLPKLQFILIPAAVLLSLCLQLTKPMSLSSLYVEAMCASLYCAMRFLVTTQDQASFEQGHHLCSGRCAVSEQTCLLYNTYRHAALYSHVDCVGPLCNTLSGSLCYCSASRLLFQQRLIHLTPSNEL